MHQHVLSGKKLEFRAKRSQRCRLSASCRWPYHNDPPPHVTDLFCKGSRMSLVNMFGKKNPSALQVFNQQRFNQPYPLRAVEWRLLKE